ncbi:MAG: periplasmic heavy metal sensor [Hyphomicrobiaceae bacterium]
MSVSEETGEATRPRRRRWLWTALVLSLAVNALFVGIALRAAWNFRNASFVSVSGVDRRLPGFVETLPPDRRQVLKQSNAFLSREQLRPLRRELRQARAEAVRAFIADPFDKQAFLAAETRLTKAEADLREAIRSTLPNIAERLTVEERRDFLRWGRHRHRGGNRAGRGPSDDDRAPPDRDP